MAFLVQPYMGHTNPAEAQGEKDFSVDKPLGTGIIYIKKERQQVETMKNIVLIGMPGTGKSVVGRALAERLNFTFVDVDDLIVEAAGKSLPDILRTEGLKAFLDLEGQVGEALDCERHIIATGGSMVLSEKAMEHLKKDSITVWLETPLSQISERMPEDLWDRGIAAAPEMDIREIYEQRKPYYAKYADLIIVSREGEDSTAHQVEEVMRIVGIYE